MTIEIIAEIANSHQGNYKTAKKIVKTFSNHGADSIKFQIYFANDFLSTQHERFDHFKKQSFSENEWEKLISYTKKIGFKNIYADVFGLKAFEVAKRLQLDGYKIHSTDLTNEILLKKVSKENKKTFLSVGGAKLNEIFHALSFLNIDKKKIILMHGFQSYPTKIQDTNLDNINKLKKHFGENYSYGYQDHISGDDEYNLYLSLISLGYGINFLEKHITLDRKKKGIDYYSSLEPNEFEKFCKIVKNSILGLSINKSGFSEAEDHYRKTTKKFWILKKDLKMNAKISLKDLDFKRINNTNIEPLFLKEFLGKRINKDLCKNTPICNNFFNKKVYAIIVARYDSKRLPGKATLKIAKKTLLEHLFLRVKQSKLINKIIFCTTKKKSDDKLVKLANKNKIKVFRGYENDVLGRILQSTDKDRPDIIVRITGDDILIDPDYMDKAITYHLSNNLDYTDHKNLPSGVETEIFNRKTLKFIYENAEDIYGTEYLTFYVRDNEEFFRVGSAPVDKKHQKKLRLTIDNLEDFEFVKPFLEKMHKNRKLLKYNIDDIVAFYKNKKRKLKKENKKIKVNTNFKKNNFKYYYI